MGALSPIHMALVFIIALLVFGPKKLPEIGRELGKAIREFKKASRDVMDSFQEAMDERTHQLPAYDAHAPSTYLEPEYRPEPVAVAASTGEGAPTGEKPLASETAPPGTIPHSPGNASHTDSPLSPHPEEAQPAGGAVVATQPEPGRDTAISPERIS